MKISCVMPTYGRYRLACRSLACFLAQSALEEAELVIYNQHPVPMRFDHPRVRVVNEPAPAGGLRQIERRALELASDSADYVHKWDDDDLYLPWFLEMGLDQAGSHVAWKPQAVWMWAADGRISLVSNFMEGTWLLNRARALAVPMSAYPRHLSAPCYPALKAEGALYEGDVGDAPPFIYCWSGTVAHYSAIGFNLSEDEQRRAVEKFRRNNNDIRPDGLLVPSDLAPTWRTFRAGLAGQVDGRYVEAFDRLLPQ